MSAALMRNSSDREEVGVNSNSEGSTVALGAYGVCIWCMYMVYVVYGIVRIKDSKRVGE
jgi:hypothetical protein